MLVSENEKFKKEIDQLNLNNNIGKTKIIHQDSKQNSSLNEKELQTLKSQVKALQNDNTSLNVLNA